MNINKSVHIHTYTHTLYDSNKNGVRKREREKSCLFVCLCVNHDLAVFVFQLVSDLAHFLDHCVWSPPCACEFHLLISLKSWPVPSHQVSDSDCDLLRSFLLVVVLGLLLCCGLLMCQVLLLQELHLLLQCAHPFACWLFLCFVCQFCVHGQCGGVPMVQLKWRVTRGTVLGCVVTPHQRRQHLVPVELVHIHKLCQHVVDRPVHPFCQSNRLWVVTRREPLFHDTEPAQVCHHLPRKALATVRPDLSGRAMPTHHVLKDESCCCFRCFVCARLRPTLVHDRLPHAPRGFLLL